MIWGKHAVHVLKSNSLHLENNPWQCDCRLEKFWTWVMNRHLWSQPTSCAQPAKLFQVSWDKIGKYNNKTRFSGIDRGLSSEKWAVCWLKEDYMTIRGWFDGQKFLHKNQFLNWISSKKLVSLWTLDEIHYFSAIFHKRISFPERLIVNLKLFLLCTIELSSNIISAEIDIN